MNVATPLRAIRENCLDCSQSFKAVAYCCCDGVHSTWCAFWPYRLGMRPDTAKIEYGKAIMTPRLMPPDWVDIDNLPKNPRDYHPLPEYQQVKVPT